MAFVAEWVDAAGAVEVVGVVTGEELTGSVGCVPLSQPAKQTVAANNAMNLGVICILVLLSGRQDSARFDSGQAEYPTGLSEGRVVHRLIVTLLHGGESVLVIAYSI